MCWFNSNRLRLFKELIIPYICRNCKLLYGHQLVWCPGCPNKLEHFSDYKEAEEAVGYRLGSATRSEYEKAGWTSEGWIQYNYYLNEYKLQYNGKYMTETIKEVRELISKEMPDLNPELINFRRGYDYEKNAYHLVHDQDDLDYYLYRKLRRE